MADEVADSDVGDAIAGVFGGVAGALSLEPPNREKRLRFFVDSSSFFSSTTTEIAQKRKNIYINVYSNTILFRSKKMENEHT